MSALTEFILERVAEDETKARDDGADAMTGYRWKHWPRDAYEEMQATTLARCRRVLAECEAKRRIVEEVEAHRLGEWEDDPIHDAILGLLALPYAGHPDYREEWRP